MTHKILVTGSSGYIGSNIVERLLHIDSGISSIMTNDRDIFPFDRLFYQYDMPTLRRCHMEIGDMPAGTLKEFDPSVIIHCAAETSVPRSMSDPAPYYRSNISQLVDLLEDMRKGEIKNLVFSSSSSVYGNSPYKPPFNEDMTGNPLSPYGQTKLMGEEIIRSYCNAYGMKAIILRYFNVAGADRFGHIPSNNTTQLIPTILRAKISETSVDIFGYDYPTPDGTAIRDYTHVSDVVDANIMAMEYLLNTDKSGLQIINIGTGRGYSLLEVLAACEDVAGKIDYKMSGRRLGDPSHIMADNIRAKEILGWEPKHSLEDIVQSAWDWFNSTTYQDERNRLFHQAMSSSKIGEYNG